MRDIYFYFDDSGVLHKNANSKYFVYAGLIFLNAQEKNKMKRLYYNVNKQIKKNANVCDELKGCNLERKHKESLYRVIKYVESMGLTVDIERVYEEILSGKKSIHRYKDYVLKLLIKKKLESLIEKGIISPEEDVNIKIFVDEQATATDGFYSLRDSVFEELKKGINNHNYGRFYKPVFTGKVEVSVSYCDSKNNYLIQASDILANRIWTSFKKDIEEMRKIPNHLCLRLP